MIHDRVLRFPARAEVTRIRVRRGALTDLGAWVRATVRPERVALVTDRNVAALHGRAALRALDRAGVGATAIVLPGAGERLKRAPSLARLWESLASLGLGRGDAVVALGGGVVGDLAGFAAATLLRGVAWVAVPTTVVAQADSAVGGKTGIDLGAGKNLAGAFHHPAGVLVDPALLRTLPDRELRAGMAEVLKTGAIADRELLARAEADAARLRRREVGALEAVVAGALAAKARIVAVDPRERAGGPRTALNFGHTLGHAIEAVLRYRTLRHGEAVAIGMRFAAGLSARFAGLPERDRRQLVDALDAWDLPGRIPGLPVAALLEAMSRDKKRRGGVRWVLTPRLGRASVPRLISERIIRAALIDHGARPA